MRLVDELIKDFLGVQPPFLLIIKKLNIMKPVNSKSLLAFTFGQMEKLDKGEIDNTQAREQSNLIKQANNLLKYELDRAKVKMELAKHNAIYKDGCDLREIESKNFEE